MVGQYKGGNEMLGRTTIKKELTDVLTRLETAGYRHSENKSEFFKTENNWIGHEIDQNGNRPLQDKLRAINYLKRPNNEKELKSLPSK